MKIKNLDDPKKFKKYKICMTQKKLMKIVHDLKIPNYSKTLE